MRAWLGASLALALSALASAAASAQSLDSTIRARIDSTSPVDEVLRSFLIAHVERLDPAFDNVDPYRYDGRRHRFYRSVPMSAADTTVGRAVLPPNTPEHPLYRCRRHQIGDERPIAGCPNSGRGNTAEPPGGSSDAGALPHAKSA
jgi:hypothetical protein